jgi:hypothetical protein
MAFEEHPVTAIGSLFETLKVSELRLRNRYHHVPIFGAALFAIGGPVFMGIRSQPLCSGTEPFDQFAGARLGLALIDTGDDSRNNFLLAFITR